MAYLELERDNKLVNHDGIIGIETWHPGNLAYALVRNPDCVDDLIKLAKQSSLLPSAKGLWLRMDYSKINN